MATRLVLDDALQEFKDTWAIIDDELLEHVKTEMARALETGSDEGKMENINEVFEGYKDYPYLIVKKLGLGSFGSVYKGIDLKTKEVIAIKTIDLEESKVDVAVIARETAALSSGSSCVQLVQYRGSIARGTVLWILMEYCGGGSVLGLVEKYKGKLPEAAVAVIVREVLKGLQHLALSSRFHRDIKAANILLLDDGQVKLGDLGAAAQLSVTSPTTSTFAGSPYWMAPEVIMSNLYDSKADIWSLGITCIEMIQGKPPHHKFPPMKAMMKITTSPPPAVGSSYSAEFRDFVAKCLTKEPAERPSLTDLLKHPFILGAGDKSIIKDLI